MWPVAIHSDRVQLGAGSSGSAFDLSFQRTLRLPEDGQVYPLPPTLGAFPVRPALAYADCLPPPWRKPHSVLIPMYQREALWLAFEAPDWRPLAVKVGVGRVNALSGAKWDERLHADPQDYLVCPPQLWLDGILGREGVVRQFVAMPLGQGYTLEAQVFGAERYGGLQVLVFDSRPGRFAHEPPPAPGFPPGAPAGFPSAGFSPASFPPPGFPAPQPAAAPAGMGIGAGGRLRQKVYADPYGLETWQSQPSARVEVHILNSVEYARVTGEPPPPSPVSAADYTRHGLPWFELYDEDRAALAGAADLDDLRSVGQLDAERGLDNAGNPEEESPQISPGQVKPVDLHP